VIDLHKYFGDLEVLKGIDLEVSAKGEVVCVIGPSGSGQVDPACGVSTGSKSPPQGTILVEGEDMTDPDADIDRADGPGSGWSSNSSTCSPISTVLGNLTVAQTKVLKRSKAGGGGDRPGNAGTGGCRRQDRLSTRSDARVASNSGWPSPGRFAWDRT
jgi:ABC-type polar amino acid transport system ATPase subunit